MPLQALMIGVLVGGTLSAQDAQARHQQQQRQQQQQQSVRAAMQSSLEKQRASARQQRASIERQRTGAARAGMNPVSAGYFIQQGAPYVVVQPLSVPAPTIMNGGEARWSTPSVSASLASVLAAPLPAATSNWPPPCPPLSDSFLTPMISAAAQTYRVDPALVREVARQESAFRPCSVSSKGAQGLMQLMPATQRMLQVGNPFDPQESLFGGAHRLSTLINRYGGNLALALSAYNAGTSRVDEMGDIPPIPETQSYVADILRRLGTLPD